MDCLQMDHLQIDNLQMDHPDMPSTDRTSIDGPSTDISTYRSSTYASSTDISSTLHRWSSTNNHLDSNLPLRDTVQDLHSSKHRFHPGNKCLNVDHAESTASNRQHELADHTDHTDHLS